MADFLIYGTTGYAGSLIAHEAVCRGYRPILAGRNPIALAALASLALFEPICGKDCKGWP